MSGRNLHFLFFIILTFNLILLSNSNDSETGQALFICNKYTCPKNRGTCNENNECVCIKGYDTVDDLSKGDFYCNYIVDFSGPNHLLTLAIKIMSIQWIMNFLKDV